jgi:hypothetical protein
MPTVEMEDWNGRRVEAIRSRGGVFAFPDYANNLIRPEPVCWPPAEIIQKLYKTEKLWAFLGEDQELLSRKVGYYCDLQSVHSEDAMHWSYFGPLVYGAVEDRQRFGCWLRSKLALNCGDPNRCCLAMWQRVPHPDNGTPNGPEVDLVISTDTFTLLAESKWRSGEGRWQGVDGTATQLQLRQRFLARFGKSLFGDVFLAVLYIVLDNSQFSSGNSSSGVPVLNIRWADLCDFSQHAYAAEVRRYYDWKRNLVVRKFGVAAPG